MNCLILLALLSCCQNDGRGTNWFGSNGCGCRRNGGGSGRREGNRGGSENDRCDCRQDGRPESRLEQRPFISYPGSSCGCEAQENNSCS